MFSLLNYYYPVGFANVIINIPYMVFKNTVGLFHMDTPVKTIFLIKSMQQYFPEITLHHYPSHQTFKITITNC